jgi:hypothetical protein
LRLVKTNAVIFVADALLERCFVRAASAECR